MNQLIKIQDKSGKLLRQQIKKRYYKTLGTSEINTKQPNVPFLPVYNYIQTHSGEFKYPRFAFFCSILSMFVM